MTDRTMLRDAAFVCAKEITGYSRDAQPVMRSALTAQYPTATPAAVTEACTAARALLAACYDLGDACRNEVLTRDEAEQKLSEQCPGFSAETYTRAISYGMFISR